MLTSYHPHDKKWINEQTRMLPSQLRAGALAKYSKLHKETLMEYEGEIAQENKARHEANSRLRAYVEKILKIKD